MKAAIRKMLEDYASGMGYNPRTVISEYKKLPERERFACIRQLRQLEAKHKEWVANGGKLDEPPPTLYGPDGEALAPSDMCEPTPIKPEAS